MNLSEFLSLLRANADRTLSFRLPDGPVIPAHFHITELGHVSKRFIDCGGTKRESETCLLQTWVHDDVDHRLTAGRLAAIFDRADDVLPHRNLPVEIEHETGVVAQFPIASAAVIDDALVFQCARKHTDCLAREICLPGECGPVLPNISLDRCSPGSGCC